jgi:hypothetical protein
VTLEPEAPTRTRPSFRALRPSAASAALGVVLLAFALLKLYSLNFVNGDEHMYFYMSLLVARGDWPYRDFFFSHPPLQLYVMAPLYKLFGYSLALSKMLPSLAAMVSGLHVYLIGRRLVGRLEGVLGAFLFLFTFDVLRGSSHFTGANCALAFGLVAAYQTLVGRQVLAGVLFAIATFTGVYMAPLALMLAVLLVFRSWRESLRLLGTFAAACLVISAIFVIAAGFQPFWYQIFGYNLNKIAFRYSWYAKLRNVAYLNSLAMVGFVPGVVWAISMWLARGRARGEPVLAGRLGRFGAWLNLWSGDRVAAQMIFATLICGYFYFYSTRVDYYSYYFMLIMPWMGLATAAVAVDVVRYLRERRRDRAQVEASIPRAERRRRSRQAKRGAHATPSGWRFWPLAACAISLVLVLVYRQGIGKDRQADMGESAAHYAWRDSPYLPGVINAFVRAVFWQPASDPAHPPNAITYYLQHESMSAGQAEGFVAAIRSECHPGERIFGEYSLGPFAAALGPCVLAANLADTNPHRWKVHESTPADWVAALEKDHLDIAVIARGDSMLREPTMRDYFAATFPRTVATWDDPYAGHVELRRRAK